MKIFLLVYFIFDLKMDLRVCTTSNLWLVIMTGLMITFTPFQLVMIH